MSDPVHEVSLTRLEFLKKPLWAPKSIRQAQRQQDQTDGKVVWNEALAEYRRLKETKAAKIVAEDAPPQTVAAKEPFPFFKLPGEIRNRVYKYYMLDQQQEREHRERDENEPIHDAYVRGGSRMKMYYVGLTAAQKRANKQHQRGYTPEQRDYEKEQRRLFNKVVNTQLKKAKATDEFCEGAQEAFDRYRLEHEMYTRRCWHEKHVERIDGDNGSIEQADSISDEDALAVRLDRDSLAKTATMTARGSLCNDLPMLSLVDRRFFSETFFFYYSTPREGLWFKWVVRNLDFFPLLRFWQSISIHVGIKSERMRIELDTTDQYKSKELHGKQFENVRRLIELHWLDGLPLWPCMTGLNEYRDAIGPFGGWMYAVRQIVAVYRIDYPLWREITIKYLHPIEDTEDDIVETRTLEAMASPDLVEITIDMLNQAMKYHLGYEATGQTRDRNGVVWEEKICQMLRLKNKHSQLGFEKEAAKVHVTCQYCARIDGLLRQMLNEAYEGWEEHPEDDMIPPAVIL